MRRAVSLAVALAAGTPVLRALNRSPDDLDALAGERLRRVLIAAARTPWHAERLRAAGLAPEYVGRVHPEEVLSALPPVTKREILAAGTGAMRDGRVRSSWFESRSSGSTGEPFRMYYDPHAWATLKYLVKWRARMACGVSPLDRIGVLDAIDVAHEGTAVIERGGRLRRISVLQPADEIARKLIALSPRALYALPSAALDAGAALGIRARALRLKAIFTSGELLTGAARKQLEHTYDAPVRDIYGTSETKEISWECGEGRAHVNADVVRVEALDDEGVLLPHGEEGALAVTLLVNRAMPLLRYQTGDRGAISLAPCPCGLRTPLLGVITGREADMLELGAGRRISPYVLTTALERVSALRRYQVRQIGRAALEVRAILSGGISQESAADQIRATLGRAIEGPLDVSVEFVSALPRGARAKFRVVEPYDQRRQVAAAAQPAEPQT